ncbi:hypothetical protein D8674_033648 [Pyrus ussuriensis x Pyrus communis]|uniref:Uncharacterized protein n=1 Tax=Pyrus ussuriensis x Pyrus communis TaxID=2448454 RepID=A0A5N5HQ84_9ROSA|nr:hypothetical protein D8674_033648 [Pyrus ussuriensis x Pyrus communis]
MPDIIVTIYSLGEAQKKIAVSVKELKNSISKPSEKVSDKDCTPREKAFQDESAAAAVYPTRLHHMPYPKGYETPNLVLFDGMKGSPKEHISCFINTLDPHVDDCNLCLKELLKSLIDCSYTCLPDVEADAVERYLSSRQEPTATQPLWEKENAYNQRPMSWPTLHLNTPGSCFLKAVSYTAYNAMGGPDHIVWENPKYRGAAYQASEVPKETEDMLASVVEDKSLEKIMPPPKCMQDGYIAVMEKLKEVNLSDEPSV